MIKNTILEQIILGHLIQLMHAIEIYDDDQAGSAIGGLGLDQMLHAQAWGNIINLLESDLKQLHPTKPQPDIDECTGPDIDQFFEDFKHV